MPQPAISTKQKTSPQDILIIQNIDMDCQDVTEDFLIKLHQEFDQRLNDGQGGWKVIKEKIPYEWSHGEFFQVKWDGFPHRIRPGETRRLVRYIGEHFAKHLSDHLLLKLEEKTGKKRLFSNPIERKKIMEKIIIGVEYFQSPDMPISQGEREVVAMEELNKTSEETAVEQRGLVPEINKIPPVDTPPDPKELDAKRLEPKAEEPEEGNEGEADKTSKKVPAMEELTNRELMEECKKMEILVTGKENKAQLIKKLQEYT